VKGDEFHLFRTFEQLARQQATEGDSDTSKCQASDQRQTHQNPAKQNNVDEQIRKVISLVEGRILVPSYVRIVIDTTQ